MTSITNFIAAAVVGFGFVASTPSAWAGDHERVVDPLWKSVEAIAASVGEGSEAVIEQWPGGNLDLSEKPQQLRIDGGGFPIDGAKRVSASRIRMKPTGELRLITLEIDGSSCITRDELRQRYPSAVTFAWPQPHNSEPYSYERVDLEGVRLSFGFPDQAPQCLFKIVFNPDPTN